MSKVLLETADALLLETGDVLLLDPPAFVMAASANISAGGTTNTTAQLTAPAGGNTFGGGKISDDTNPSPSVDLAVNQYGEWELCLQADSEAVVAAEVYEFRVTRGGIVLDTYSVTPQWTIGTPAQVFVPRQVIISQAVTRAAFY